MENKNNNRNEFRYNHSEIISGMLFLIIVFIGMAVAAKFMN